MPRSARVHHVGIPALAITAALLPSLASAQSDPLAALPTRFVPNAGQWASPELFRAHVGGLQVFLEPRGWSFWLRESAAADVPLGARPRPGYDLDVAPPSRRAVALRMTFAGAAGARVVPETELAGATSFLLGADVGRHRAGVTSYASVRYESMYEGVDVRVRDGGGHFEYDLVLAPGADLSQVEIRVDGARSMSSDESGRLVIQTPLGEVVQPRPDTWMVTADGSKRSVLCDYELRGEDRFGFVAPQRDPELELIVDPPIVYSTYYGGSAWDQPRLVVEDGNGRIVVCGRTQSFDYPTSPGSLQTTIGGGTGDGFIVCLDPTQPPASQVVFATYFGGSDNDAVNAVTVLPGGQIAFVGQTRSLGLPTTPGALQPNHAGDLDGVIGVLDPTGSSLTALTYLGGTGRDRINGVQLSPMGDLMFTGDTRSTDYPTTPNAFQPAHAGGPSLFQDGLVGRIDVGATLLMYSSFLGGSGEEWLWCGDVGATGVMTIVGASSSVDFPTTTNAYSPTSQGGNTYYWWSAETVVLQLDTLQPPAQQLTYSTFLGGTRQDQPSGVKVNSRGQIVVAGTTNSLDFPTTPGAYQSRNLGGSFISTNYLAGDAFVSVLDPGVSGAASLVVSTYVGGRGQDQGLEPAVDSDGVITFVGWSEAIRNDYPTTPDALRRTYGANDGYVTRLSADGRQLLYSSYLGGLTDADGAWLIARHTDGSPTIVGATNALDFPTERAVQPNYAGQGDTFITRMSLVPDGTARVGAPSAHAGGSPTIHALGDATPGNAQFGVACSQAEPGKPGVLLLGLSSTQPVSFFGIDFWVDLPTLIASLPVPNADPSGESAIMLPLPTTPLGTLYFQYVWVNALTPFTLSASDALRIN